MSAFIGHVNGPRHNSAVKTAEVWCSPNSVELTVIGVNVNDPNFATGTVRRSVDPIAARNLAALLVRASEEAERMEERRRKQEEEDRTPHV